MVNADVACTIDIRSAQHKMAAHSYHTIAMVDEVVCLIFVVVVLL